MHSITAVEQNSVVPFGVAPSRKKIIDGSTTTFGVGVWKLSL